MLPPEGTSNSLDAWLQPQSIGSVGEAQGIFLEERLVWMIDFFFVVVVVVIWRE